MKVVLDTNIFISGIFWKGDPNKIVLAWKEGKFILVSSMDIISELINVLKDFKIRLPDDLLSFWIDSIVKNSEFVKLENKLKVVMEDPTDDKFLETALNGKADYLVTQDKHLLKLGEFCGIKIIIPTEFLKKL